MHIFFFFCIVKTHEDDGDDDDTHCVHLFISGFFSPATHNVCANCRLIVVVIIIIGSSIHVWNIKNDCKINFMACSLVFASVFVLFCAFTSNVRTMMHSFVAAADGYLLTRRPQASAFFSEYIYDQLQ